MLWKLKTISDLDYKKAKNLLCNKNLFELNLLLQAI